MNLLSTGTLAAICAVRDRTLVDEGQPSVLLYRKSEEETPYGYRDVASVASDPVLFRAKPISAEEAPDGLKIENVQLYRVAVPPELNVRPGDFFADDDALERWDVVGVMEPLLGVYGARPGEVVRYVIVSRTATEA